MKNLFRISEVILLIISIHSCETDDANAIKDGDGNVYTSVTIGTQVWMKENLKTTRYSNSDLIGTTSPATKDISSESTPKYQWAYDGNENNVATYGRLYTWFAIMDNRNVCPKDWHVPTDAEWTTLTDYLALNGYGYQGIEEALGKSLAATSGWHTNEISGNIGKDPASNNSSGFTALPGGLRNYMNLFYLVGLSAGYWSSTESDAVEAWFRGLGYNFGGVDRNDYVKYNGFSVRCIKDK